MRNSDTINETLAVESDNMLENFCPIQVNAHNEWDPLEEIVVGIIDNAKTFPKSDYAIQIEMAALTNQLPNEDIVLPEFPDFVVEETREDLEIFANELKKLGIKVHRPDAIDTSQRIKTPYWSTEQFYNYCPRDVLLTIGDTIIESPNVNPSRFFEAYSYRDLMLRCMEGGANFIATPKPRLRKQEFNYNYNPDTDRIMHTLDPIFDAANIIKAGKDIFYLVSSSGNEAGYKWLKRALGSKYRVHALENIYEGFHIDTTITLLRPGLVLVNPARINKDNLPTPFQKWDVIYAPKMEAYNYSNLTPLASSWLGLNLLSVSPNLAVVDKHQTALIKVLEKHKIDVLPLQLRHGNTLGGGFHCVTLDLKRKGTMEDYF